MVDYNEQRTGLEADVMRIHIAAICSRRLFSLQRRHVSMECKATLEIALDGQKQQLCPQFLFGYHGGTQPHFDTTKIKITDAPNECINKCT